MPTNFNDLARSILDRLVDADLIEVEAHDEAIEALGSALANARNDDVVGLITRFLEENEVVDEIYASDMELESVIKKALVPGGEMAVS